MKRVAYVLAIIVLGLGGTIGYIRYRPPLTATTMSMGTACPTCPDPLKGPWIRLELENIGFAPVVVKSVVVEGLPILSVSGITSDKTQLAISPHEDQHIFPYRGWAILPSNEESYALHLALTELSGNSPSNSSQITISYTYLGLPFTIAKTIRE